MATRIEAIYEHGVFRPTGPVTMTDGERVQIVVLRPEDTVDVRSPASILDEIAALPLESDADETAARDHDRYLYHPGGS